MHLPEGCRRLIAMASVLTFLAVLTACSSSGSKAGSPSSSGSPYKIMLIGPITAGAGVQYPPQPELSAGAKAAAQAINAAGGVDGHPIQLEVCDTQNLKNGGVTCATKAIRDKVLAVVGAIDFYGDYTSVLKSAGIPNVAPLPIQAELSDTNSYPLQGGASVVPAGVVSYVAKQGATSMAYVGNTSAYTSAIPQLTKSVVDKHPGFKLNLISVPLTAADVQPYVTQALKDSYVDVTTVTDTATLSFIKDYLADGGKASSIIASVPPLTPAVIKTLGASAEGIKVNSLFTPPTDPTAAAEQFTKDMNAVDPSAQKDESSENAYLAVKLFAAAVKGHSPNSGADVAASLDKVTNLDLGLLPPVSFDKPIAGAPAPRIFNDAILVGEIRGGVVVSAGGHFFSAYTGADIPV
jgi:ABC-type branched-subunit amino acid transport system substrate-binding protein